MSELTTQTPAGVIAEIRSPEFREQLAAALPPGITADRFQRIAITALLDDQIRQPDPAKQLLSCDRASLFQAILRCAQDGLNPDGREAALVKRGNKVVYQPMVTGLRKIAAHYGWTIRSAAVREADDFDFTEEPPSLYHKVAVGNRGELCYAYAVARHKDGRREQRVMTRDEVLKRMAVATTKNVWEQWPDEMWAKSATRDIFAELPYEVAARIAEHLAEVDPAEVLYGPNEYSEQESRADDAASGEGDPPTSPAAPDLEDEPGPSDIPGVDMPPEPNTGEADIGALAAQAAGYVPPNGKYAAGGPHGPKTLAEILALGDDGERWIRWALGKITEPPEYQAAVWSFARVHAVAPYQETLARQEART